jgi:hypothetical protein
MYCACASVPAYGSAYAATCQNIFSYIPEIVTRSRLSRVHKIKHFDSFRELATATERIDGWAGCFRKVVSIRNKFVPDWRHQSAHGPDGPGARALLRGSAPSTDPVF